MSRPLYCSFCGKKQADVLRLLGAAKLGAFICNECVEDAMGRLAAEGVQPFCHFMKANVVPFPPSGRRRN
jgi:ATP-dependent protease Clp ATPase subunit